MMKRLTALGCALLLSVGVARAAPAINTWEGVLTQIWPRSGSGLAADTLARFDIALGDTKTDSVSVTDSVMVYGARYILLLGVGSGTADSISVILQMKMPGSETWIGTGGAAFMPYSCAACGGPFPGMTPNTLNGMARGVWGIYNEPTSAGSYPLPFVNTYYRWRVKSADKRRYNSANQATLASTGNITIYALIWR